MGTINPNATFIFVLADGLVAQLDRARDYGSRGCGFESHRARSLAHKALMRKFWYMSLQVSFDIIVLPHR